MTSAAAQPAAASDLSVEVIVEMPDWTAAMPGIADLARRWAGAAFAAAAPGGGAAIAEIAILFASDARMRALNRRYRGLDRPTNVLSFGTWDDGAAETASAERAHIGDLALGWETAAREARAGAVAIEDHAAHLVVHGLLHLLGYDHAEEREAREMEALESAVLASLGMRDPYGERPADVAMAGPAGLGGGAR